MQNSGFEKSVRQQMDELKITPSKGLWEKIEPKLPAPPRHRRWLVLLLLIAFLSAGTIYTWRQFAVTSNDNRNTQTKSARTLVGTDPGAKQEPDKNNVVRPEVNDIVQILPEPESLPVKDPEALAGAQKRQVKQKLLISGTPESRTGISSNRKKSPVGKQASKTAVKISGPGTENGDKIVTGAEAVQLVESDPAAGKDTNSVSTSNSDSSPAPDISTTVKSVADTAEQVLVTTSDVAKRSGPQWQYGLHLGAGFSTVKNSLFSNSAIFADAQGSLSSGGSGNAPAAAPQNPTPALSFEGGLYLKRQLGKRWAISTGLNYAYLSNSIQTGSRIDTTAVVTFSTRSLETGNYFRTGNGTTYRNKFHLLDMPLLVSYYLPGKFPLSAEFGSTIGYLLNSNAIVYSKSIRGYVTDADVFNKMLLSLNAGAAINLKQWTGYPLNLGYRFRYSLSSVTKKAFGGQHLLNSTFYLDIPLKK